jgi:hypothetical protein
VVLSGRAAGSRCVSDQVISTRALFTHPCSDTCLEFAYRDV